LETNLISENYEKPNQIVKQTQQQQQHHQHPLKDHESYLMCPGRQPIKIGSTNQPVSIHIYFNNFVHRKKHHAPHHANTTANGGNDIYLRIVEKEIHGNNSNNHHDNNRINNHHGINASHNNNLKARKVLDYQNATRRINLIKNNNNVDNGSSSVIEENDGGGGNVKHFINIYHWIVHSTADEFVSSEKANKK
jgi:hypothetical protein